MCNFVSSRLIGDSWTNLGSENAGLPQHGLAAGEHSPVREEGDDPLDDPLLC